MSELNTYSRRTVMKACAVIAHLGHSDLTQFFNELGLEDFDAPYESGSRHTRAMKLCNVRIEESSSSNIGRRLAYSRDRQTRSVG
jgi:hypothetical protein